jgi:hypothetical protein
MFVYCMLLTLYGKYKRAIYVTSVSYNNLASPYESCQYFNNDTTLCKAIMNLIDTNHFRNSATCGQRRSTIVSIEKLEKFTQLIAVNLQD